MFNYEEIGKKIKGLAKWAFIVEAIAAVITGIVFMAEDEDMIPVAFLIIIAGPVIAWVSSWLLYGFGQLVDNSDIIAEEYIRANEKHDAAAAKREAQVQKQNAQRQAQHREAARKTVADPTVDEDTFIDVTCPSCQTKLAYPKSHLKGNQAVVCPICDASISL